MPPVGQSLETPLETITVNDDRIACDGTDGSLGHPRVYLNLGPKGETDCPYCGRHYVLKAGAKAGHGH